MLTLSQKIFISILLIILFFSLAFISSAEKQFSNQQNLTSIKTPGDWIKQDQIKVYPNQIVLNVQDATWATFTPTGSMKPILDEKTNALEIKPSSPNDINLGDIIAYISPDGTIIHRVIEKNIDENGIYFLVKGDNNPSQDPTKVRFEDIKGVVIAIIY